MTCALDFLPAVQRRRVEDLRGEVAAGRVSVLIGAGVSRRAGMPDGGQLARTLADGRGLDPAIAGDLIAVCDALLRIDGPAWLRGELARLLDDERYPLSDAHLIMARSPYAAYATTNVDRLMEWALADAGVQHSAVFLEEDAGLWGTGRRPVVKLHGTIDHPHTMVFTSEDFDRFAGFMAGCLHNLLGLGRLLIVGYRAVDPNFLRILDLVNRTWGGQPHAIIDFGREHEREELARRNLFLIDPGEGLFDLLPELLAYIGGLDRDDLSLCSSRHQQVYRANPFPGLAPYGLKARDFHGRAEDAARICDGLDGLGPVTVFFGESGCGKTSLFQAGILPMLEQRGEAWVLAPTVPGSDPMAQLAVAIDARLGEGEAAGGLHRLLHELRREERRLIVVIDQFERVLLPEPTPEAVRFLSEDLPALARSFPNTLRVLIVLRSDALSQLHPFRTRQGLNGVFFDAERLTTLDRAAARRVLSDSFGAKGWRLQPAALAAMVAKAATGRGDAVYLPYLQLLARSLFSRLAEERTGRGRTTVTARDVGRIDSTDIILRHVYDAALVLARIEPDRATILKLYDLLTERHRRAILRRDRIVEEFVEADRVLLLLQELSSRRLVHFDEVIEGYELVHDSLVQPVRDFLDQQRTDFSNSDILALAGRLFSGQPLSNAAVANLALHCIRRGLSPAWLEQSCTPAEGWPQFWVAARLSCPAERQAALWGRIASWAHRTGKAPHGVRIAEVLSLLLTTRDRGLALAAARLLGVAPLAVEDVEVLWRWLDPDRADEGEPEGPGLLVRLGLPDVAVGALDTAPLRRGWMEVVDALIDAVCARGRVPLPALFAGYHSRVYSEAGWWEPYARRLLLAAGNRRGTQARRRLDDLLEEAGEDPELLNGLADAMLANPEIVARWPDRLQRILAGLARRVRRQDPARLLAVAEATLEAMPKAVFVQLLPIFSDLVRAGQGRRAARILGLAAQEQEDLLTLLDRASLTPDLELMSWLQHAAVESPAEVEGAPRIDAGLFAVLVIDLHRPEFRQRLTDAVTGPAWRTEATALFGQWPDEELVVRAYALALLDNGSSDDALWMLWSRLWRLLCHETLCRGRALGMEMPEGDPLETSWSDVALLWDQATEAMWGVEARVPNAADTLGAQLRWLRRCVEGQASADPEAREMLSLLDGWFTRYPDLAYQLRGDWATTGRPLPGRSALFQALQRWTQGADHGEGPLVDLVARLGLGEAVRPDRIAEALSTYRQSEDRAVLRSVALVAEEIVAHAAQCLPTSMPSDAVAFLWEILGRSGWLGLTGLPERVVSERVLDALLRAYSGAEEHFLESLTGTLKEPDWQLRALVRTAGTRPDLACRPLGDLVAAFLADGEQPPDLTAAIGCLGNGSADLSTLSLLRDLSGQPEEGPARAALRSLLRLSDAPADRVFVLHAILHRPELGTVWEEDCGVG